MNTRTFLFAKSPRSRLPSVSVTPKLRRGGPELGSFNRVEAG